MEPRAPSTTSSREFSGTARHVLGRRLGAGGTGVVYAAFDRKWKRHVALKTLKRQDPAGLVRFKREFRALADATHPNMVQLYELHLEGDDCYFTMELVEGDDFVRYVSGQQARAAQGTRASTLSGAEWTAARDADGPECAAEPPPPSAQRPDLAVDLPRLRAALGQLAGAIHALHEMGKLHRDLKPSNVLVDHDGRVVLLDFGLVVELDGRENGASRSFAGTPAYMSIARPRRTGSASA